MPEGSKDAAILIATSYQALYRAFKTNNKDMLFTNCTVLILFAGFFVEATLNYIFEFLNIDIKAFPRDEKSSEGIPYPGMQAKLAFFYNEFIKESKSSNWRNLLKKSIYEEISAMFPGFSDLHEFRNDISHGRINEAAKSFETAIKLREQAKDIVDHLYTITTNKGYSVKRLENYRDAIASLNNH
jgi:hypothetical protein